MLFSRKKSSETSRRGAAADIRIRLHRNRMAGLWAAELLGLIGQAAQDYAREVAHVPRAAGEDGEDVPHEDAQVLTRLTADLRGKVAGEEIRQKLTHLLTEARRQLGRDRRQS